MLNFKISVLLVTLFLSLQVFADGENYKNSLIGGRASTMGGAYSAISDDASGSYYNPAGLVYASGDSISGSANTYSISETTYAKAIGGNDWERENRNLLPNFFGLVKKKKNFTFGFSYVVRDSYIEHQDQIHRNLTDVATPIDVYVLNLHSEDNTYMVGPSFSKEINSKFSMGLTLYYTYRVFRRSQAQLIEYSNATDESTYLNNVKKEKGAYAKLGFMYTPKEKISMGLTIAKNFVLTSFTETQNQSEGTVSSNIGFLSESSIEKRKLPLELTYAIAYFRSPYNIFSFDIDYFVASDSEKENTWNLSFGAEHFFNEVHALRYGVFTNRSNSKEPSTSTVGPVEHIDFYGASLGYAFHAKSSSITFGTVYSMGSGESQPYDRSAVIVDVDRYTLNFVISADYGF